MKTVIVTPYNSENCGSFLQAWALQKVLENHGYQAEILKRSLKDTPYSTAGHLKLILIKTLKGQPGQVRLIRKTSANFRNAQKKLHIVKDYDPDACFILGSDTIWNFSSDYFRRHARLYLGLDQGPENCITYAASVSDTDEKTFASVPDVSSALNTLDSISVRDIRTQDMVKQFTERETAMVCDPTILLEPKYFAEILKEPQETQPYILIYYFRRFDEETKKHILELKEKKGLKLISFGGSRTWCDTCVPYDPFTFLGYMKNASFVITDTFHGTLFSVIYERKFADYAKGRKKIVDFLNKVHMNNCIAEKDTDLNLLYERAYDYASVNKETEQMRKESEAWLMRALAEMEEHRRNR